MSFGRKMYWEADHYEGDLYYSGGSDRKIIEEYPNPELLNDGSETAPSKRLTKLIVGYQKTLHGPLIAEETGIERIRKKCPRFSQWIDRMVAPFKNG